jgi:antitoxin YefM
MDRAVEDREVVLARRRGGGDVALIAADELNGLIETAHLLRSPHDAQRLLTALARAREERPDPIPLDALKRTPGGDA